ncbi:MAG: GTP cyclohydrolase FolE2 [Pseudomonadales bacterium]|jgi:GTP cyclohydrolase I|nr:GTP cyclohydrolase FolE2 [Pseudomonadales bacterium]
MSTASVVTFTGGMPDIANHAHQQPQGTLDWVGMSGIHQPFTILDAGRASPVHGEAQVYVDLADAQAKGIHMSRLYLQLEAMASGEALTPRTLHALLAGLLESHDDLSTRAFVEIRFQHFVRRQALKSDNSGWASYPVRIRAQLKDGKSFVELGVDVTYSSTCPCSAALARQLIQQQFEEDFATSGKVDAEAVRAWLGTEQGVVATPHSQRSVAEVLTTLADDLDEFPITALVDLLEGTLKTPVQAAVKREDEQEFARLNGQNLMFCEDAGRKIKGALLEDDRVEDFWVRINHYESLHGHDAVAVVTAGRADGYAPIP